MDCRLFCFCRHKKPAYTLICWITIVQFLKTNLTYNVSVLNPDGTITDLKDVRKKKMR